MTKGPVEAHLTEEGLTIFSDVFPNGYVPLKGLVGGPADLAGLGRVEVQIVDVEALSTEQLDKLLNILAERFRAPRDEVKKEILRAGLPIRRTLIDVIVIRDPQRWCA